MQFTPAGASAARQKLGAGPPGRPIEAASAGGAPERVRAAQFAITRSSGRASRVCLPWDLDGQGTNVHLLIPESKLLYATFSY